MRPRKVHALPAIVPEPPPEGPPDAPALRAWRRRQLQADRADARALSVPRAGWHPFISEEASLDPRAVEAAAAAASLPPLKRGDRSLVLKISRLAEAPALGSVVLKHYLSGKFPDPRDACGRSKAMRSLLAARALQRRGFATAHPIAAWSRPGEGSWLLLQALEEHAPLHEAAGRLPEAARRRLLEEFALCLRQLHAAGVAYRDLKPSNVMVTRFVDGAGSSFRFAFIDHDRNRFYAGPAPRRLALRDLAAVHAGLPPQVRATERWRALACYDLDLTVRERWHREVRPILLEAARRRHRWVPRRLLGGA